MIILVGDKPSAKNINPNIPFVGTQSYKRLLDWIFKLDIDVTDVVLGNVEHIKQYSWAVGNNNGEGVYIETPHTYCDIMPGDAVIALGKAASEALDSIGVKHFQLPHSSGLNRQINNARWLNVQLKACKKYITGE